MVCIGQAADQGSSGKSESKKHHPSIHPSVMEGRGETGEVTQGRKKGENLHTSVHPQSLNQSLIMQNITIPLLSAIYKTNWQTMIKLACTENDS